MTWTVVPLLSVYVPTLSDKPIKMDMGPATQTLLLHLHVACSTDRPYRKPMQQQQQQQQRDTNSQ